MAFKLWIPHYEKVYHWWIYGFVLKVNLSLWKQVFQISKYAVWSQIVSAHEMQVIVTSCQGKAFCIIVPLWGESTAMVISDSGFIRGQKCKALVFFSVFILNNLFNKQLRCWWFRMPWGSCDITLMIPDSNIYANMGLTWVLSAPGLSHLGPMNLAIRGILLHQYIFLLIYFYPT